MTYSEDEFLLLSGIQHYSYCRRQWALIHIENLWQENTLTIEGQIIHKRSHDRTLSEKRVDELVIHGMPIRSVHLGVTGECDTVIFTQDVDGIALQGRTGLWRIMPVEYKHGHSKASDCDRLQVTAQVICLEEMFCCRIERAALYYYETRSREYVEISDELRSAVDKAFSEMHDLYSHGFTPKVKPSKQCDSCSLQELCLPKLLRHKKSVKEYVSTHIAEGDEI